MPNLKFIFCFIFFIWFFLDDIYCCSCLFALSDQVANLKCLLQCYFTETFIKGEKYYDNIVCQDPCYYLYSIFKPFERSLDHSWGGLLTQKANTEETTSLKRPTQKRTTTIQVGETYVLAHITLKIHFLCWMSAAFIVPLPTQQANAFSLRTKLYAVWIDNWELY